MRTRRSAAQWGELVSAWESSGLTADVFASGRGIAGASLRWWKTELARRARKEPPQRSPRYAQPSKAAGHVALARVVRPAQGSNGPGQRDVVAVVVGGARIVVERGFDSLLLRDVVRALEEAR